jgi:hypothetical protein
MLFGEHPALDALMDTIAGADPRACCPLGRTYSLCQGYHGRVKKAFRVFRRNAVNVVTNGDRHAVLALLHAKLRLHFHIIIQFPALNKLLKLLNHVERSLEVATAPNANL